MFGVIFLLSPISTAENCLGRILTHGTNIIRAANLKIGSELIGFAPETYPHCFGCNSYCFSSVWRKDILVDFWRHFRVRKVPK